MKSRRGLRRVGAGLLLMLSGVLLLFLLLGVRLRPLLRELAVSEARNAAGQTIQSVVAAHMASGELDYERLIRLEKDAEGFVTAAVADMRYLNSLQATLSAEIIRRLTAPNASMLSLPLGNLTGVSLLSGRGPEIPIRVLSVSDCEARLVSGFSDAGINQTLHRVLIEVRAEIHVLIPGGTATASVTDTVTAAETVIVGRVPESYMYFESDDNWDEALEQYDILS